MLGLCKDFGVWEFRRTIALSSLEASYRRQIADLRQRNAKLEASRIRLLEEAQSFEREAARLRSRTRSRIEGPLTVGERRALDLDQRRTVASARATEIHRGIVANVARIEGVQPKLDRLLARAQRERDRRLEHDRQRELNHERALTREMALRRKLFTPGVSKVDFDALPSDVSILIVAANPLESARLGLEYELRKIEHEISTSEYRDALDLHLSLATTPRGLQRALNKHKPSVLHFSGHGTERGQLVFTDDDGMEKPVSPAGLSAAIATASDPLRLVVFNACFSLTQAELVVEHVESAIGMTSEIGEDEAWVFAGALYGAIGSGLSVKRAFEQACAALTIEGLCGQGVPQLRVRAGVDADEIVLVAPLDHPNGSRAQLVAEDLSP